VSRHNDARLALRAGRAALRTGSLCPGFNLRADLLYASKSMSKSGERPDLIDEKRSIEKR
jgi:hypothetical protein